MLSAARRLNIIVLAAASATAIAAAPFFGGISLSLSQIFAIGGDSPELSIFWFVRFPRVIAAFLAGGLLASAGLAAQAVFQNPLASPFTLGISSGAALGAGTAMILGAGSASLLTGQAGWALLGALISAVLVGFLGSRRESPAGYGLIVAGLVINFFFSSLVVVVQYAADPSGVFRIMRWLMGGVDSASYGSIAGLAAIGLIGFVGLVLSAPKLDLLSLGDELALSRGLNPDEFRRTSFVLISLVIGAVVAFCGPIGFVDIIIPQIARKIWGFGHRRLFVGAFLLGGLALLLCDTAARVVIFPAEIPAGVVASILGGPLFLWIIMGRGAKVRA